MIKQAVVFKFTQDFNIETDDFYKSIAKVANRHCGLTEESCVGWNLVNNMDYVHPVSGFLILSMRHEKRDLPSSIYKKEVAARMAKVEERTGRKPSRSEKKEIKEEARLYLLPQVLVKEKNTYIWIDPKNNLIGMEVGSVSKGEAILSELYEVVNNFPPATVIQTANSVGSLMQAWLEAGDADGDFSISDECELVTATAGEKIKYSRHTLQGDDVRKFLSEGKTPSKLGASFDEQIEFVFDQNLVFKKISLIDFELGEVADDVEAFQGTMFAFMSIFSRAYLQMIEHCGGGTSADDDVAGFDD